MLLPSDIVQVDHFPRRFAVYGAITKPGNISINSPSPNLSELLAETGGLNDMQAEASSVFVFRSERLYEDEPSSSIAYRLDFAKPDAFLLANQFAMLPSDVVYVATADASEFRKFMATLLSPLLGGATGMKGLGN